MTTEKQAATSIASSGDEILEQNGRPSQVSCQAVLTRAPGTGMMEIVRRVFSFPVFLGALLVGGMFVTLTLNLREVTSSTADHTNSFIEGDTWWHIAVGEHILSTHSWPTKDTYSFTSQGNDWIAYEWLGETAMALAARTGGLRGLAALLIAITGIFLLLLYYYCYLCSGNVKAAFVACAVILVPTAICFSLRPQLFGYAFLLVTLICLERFRRGRQKALWVLPLVFALWANTHGSFVFGLMVLGTYWAAGSLHFNLSSLESVRWTPQQGRHIGLISLLSVLALNLTPYGTRLLAYPFQMAFSQPVNIANVQEWRPMPFELLPGKMFLGMVLLFLLAQVLWRLTYPLEDLALLLFAIYAACVHRRFILFFALLFAPWLARLLARWAPRYYAERDPYALNFILIVMIAAGMAKFFPSNRELDRVMANGFPKGAVDYLRQHPAPGPLFNEYFWGGYLIQSLAPQQKVFIDGRADVYEDNGVFSDYLLITSLDYRTLSLLHKYGVKACLIDSKSPLAAFLGSLPDWERVYGNNTSVLFFRKERAPGPPGVSAGARPKPATTFGADAAMVSAGGLLAGAF